MSDEERLIEAACRKAGCKKKDLLKSRLSADGQAVILIIGPAGRKVRIEVSSLPDEKEEKKVPAAPVKPTHAEDAAQQQVAPSPKKK